MLYLVRHGRTQANAEHRLQGRADHALDEVGLRQVEALRAALTSVDRVICSPLQRARQTALAFDREAEIDDRWLELDYGTMEGARLAEIPREQMRHWIDDPDYAPEGGETLRELQGRVWPACEELIDSAREHDVVVVTHATPIRAAVTWALGADIGAAWRCHVDPATITRILFRDRQPILAGFNQAP